MLQRTGGQRWFEAEGCRRDSVVVPPPPLSIGRSGGHATRVRQNAALTSFAAWFGNALRAAEPGCFTCHGDHQAFGLPSPAQVSAALGRQNRKAGGARMNDKLSSTLQRFSETEEPITEAEIVTAIRVLRKKDDTIEPPTEWLAEVMAFDFRENAQSENNPWGTYYGPMGIWNAPDGTAVESPSITKVTPEMLSYWERRAQEVKNVVLKARYADLVWDFSKHVTGTASHINNAYIVIDSTILMASKQSHTYAVHVITKLERALSLAISINDNSRISRVAQTILDFEDVIAEDSKRGLWGFSYDLLWNNRKVNLNEEQRSKILSDLESHLQRVSKISQDSTPDPWAAENAALRLASHYRKENRPGETRRVLTLYGRAFEEHCKSGSPLQVSFWLQKVLSVYLEYGLKDEAEKIARKLREIGPDVISDMKPSSHTMENT